MKAAIIVSTTSHFIVKRANNWKRECAQSFEKSRKDSKFKQEEKKKSPKILVCFKRLRRENVPKSTFLATHGSINWYLSVIGTHCRYSTTKKFIVPHCRYSTTKSIQYHKVLYIEIVALYRLCGTISTYQHLDYNPKTDTFKKQ